MNQDIKSFVSGYEKAIEELQNRINKSVESNNRLKTLEDYVNLYNDITQFIYHALAEIEETKQILQGNKMNDQTKLTLIKGGKEQ